MVRTTPRSTVLALGAFVGATSCSPAIKPATDAATDSPATTDLSCAPEESSTFPHVRLTISASTCTFTLAEAMAGISVPYDLIVDQDVPGFAPAATYPYASDAANLVLNEVLAGQAQRYCVCDKGLPDPGCPTDGGGIDHQPPDASPPGTVCSPVTVPAGDYHRAFTWDGRNWGGPSDTFRPEGALFPAGDYQLTISTAPGSVGGQGLVDDAGVLQATATVAIRLVP
jgi:hypothetical protein